MARCTAPSRGHRSEAARQNCPACRHRSRGYSSGYSSRSSWPASSGSSSTSRSNGASSSSTKSRPRWSPASSSVSYTVAEVRSLIPIRQTVESRASIPDLRDVFLCHAWDDRNQAAKDLHDMLEAQNVSVWFSEKDVPIGTPLLREIDKGLAKSRIGVVLVTPALLERLKGEGIADKELSALLASEQLVPIVHGTTYEELREVSGLLASRRGLSTTSEDSLADVASKLAELITV